MPITRALQFDQTPNRMLLEIGEQARQDEMMQRKLQQDNSEKQYQLLQQINPATLYPKFEKEVVDKTIGGLVSGVASYLKENSGASYVDLQNKINEQLSPVAEWSARVKTVKDTIKNNVASIGADEPYDKSRLMALATDRALYKTDDLGRKVLKSPEEIDIEADYVSIAKDDETVIDPFKGQDNALKMVRDAPLTKFNDTKTVETPDGRKTTTTGTVSELPFYLQKKDGQLAVKQDDNGFINETVYSTFYTNPATKAWVNAGAKDVMRKLGVPDSPEANEYFKRAYLTNWLEVQTKGELTKVNKLLYTPKPAGVTVNVGQGGPGVDNGRMPAFKNLLSALKAGEDPMTSTKIDNNIKNALLTIADENGVFRAANIKVTPDMIDTKIGKDGSVAIYSKSTGKLIAALSEQSFDQRVNEVAGGKFVGSATVGGNPDPTTSGKQYKGIDPKTGKAIFQ